ncbi:MAG: hypothetical protein HY553_09805, partial [Elusimicrobia bacterium]|nr:hypothetical protein [Elusimicrobiota bacterium]
PGPERPARPARPEPPADKLPPSLDEAQAKRLRALKPSLPPATYKRLIEHPELAQDPAGFLNRWDKLVNGFGLRAGAAVLFGTMKAEEACVARLAQLLRWDPLDVRRLTALAAFADVPVERRALAIRDKIVQQARRWESTPDAVIRVLTGRQSEREVALQVFSRKLKIQQGPAAALLSSLPPAEPAAQAAELAKSLLAEAAQRKIALPVLIQERIARIETEERVLRTVARDLAISPELAAKLVRSRGPDVVPEARALADTLGCSKAEAARQLIGELPEGELHAIVGRALAADLKVERQEGTALAKLPDLRDTPPAERAKSAARRVRALAEQLGVGSREAVVLLLGTADDELLGALLASRLALSPDSAGRLVRWVRAQGGALADAVVAAAERVEETRKAESCSADQAAQLVGGVITPAELRDKRLADELGISIELARKLAAWLEAEKVAEPDAKARLRNLRSWAAPDMEQACRMLLKEIPTPKKSDSDVLPYSGAWE